MLNLKIKSLTLRNFLSTGNITQVIRLEDHGLTLILGNNTDSNGGATRNGAGKTSIVQAISYALYGQPLTKIKIDNLINNINQKGMMVTIDFEKDGVDYRIERGRKPNVLRFYLAGNLVEDLSRGENSKTQEQIDALIGMSWSMFNHLVLMTTAVDPFLRLRTADQRTIIEELLGVTQISTRAETLKKLIAQTKASLQQEKADIRAAQGVNARIEAEMKEIEIKKKQWEINHTDKVNTLARQISELQEIDFDGEKLLFDQLDAWNGHQRDLVGKLDLTTNQLTRVTHDIKHLTGEIARLKADQDSPVSTARLEVELERKVKALTELEEQVPAMEAKIAAKQSEIDNPGEHVCITCAQPLAGTEHLKTVLANLERQKTKLEADLEKHHAAVRSTTNDIETVRGEIKLGVEDAKKRKAVLIALIAEKEAALAQLTEEQATHTKQISDLKDQMTLEDDKPVTLFRSRDELYSTKHLLDNCITDLERERNVTNPHAPHLSSLEGTLQAVDFDEINRLRELHSHQEFLFKLLTNKDSFIRKKIIEQNLFYLNTRLNFYLEKLGLPHEVVFQNDLSVDIMLLGRDFDFAQLSRGESNRVIMAVSWAFRDVWESLNYPINLFFCDEMIDSGLDGQGAEAALSILKSFSRNGKNVFLISHRDELVGRIDRTLLVSKENGFTTISEDLS